MIVAIGAFDGFHKGHQALLQTAAKRATEKKTQWAVVTFEGHPQQFLSQRAFELLYTQPERDLLARVLGIPQLIKLPFSRAFADQSPEEFFDFLRKRVLLDGVIVGEDFRFGRARTGTPELLTELCHRANLSCDIVPSLYIDDVLVSSSEIRALVELGKFDAVTRLQGYPFWMSGLVTWGDARGRKLGFPTANLVFRPEKKLPGRGVYAALVWVASCGRFLPGAVNIGFNPTFSGVRGLRFEAHLLDFEAGASTEDREKKQESLYEKNLCVFMIARIRDEVRFDHVEALKKQIAKDIQHVRVACSNFLARPEADFLRRFDETLSVLE